MAEPLRLYLVERKGAGPGGCNAYVVLAESEDRAMWYCPEGGAATPDVRITEVSLVDRPGVVLARFNTG